MKLLTSQPSLAEQVHKAILDEIAAGRLQAGSRVIQEQIASELGVSRQPVQQALILLRNQGVLRDAPGRGLLVAPLDLDYVRNMYDIRAVLEGLAFRRAAELNAKRAKTKGPALIRAGREAVASGSITAMIAADMAFHGFVYSLSENPLIASELEAHWTNTQRVMGEVLLRDTKPRDIWDEHATMLEAIVEGDGAKAEKLARQHISMAAEFMIKCLLESAAEREQEEAPPKPRRRTGTVA